MKRAAVVWAYVVEALLVALGYLLVRILASPADISAFLEFAWGPLLGLLGVAFAGQLAIFVFYLQKGSSDFGNYLDHVGAESTFTVGFVAPLGITLVAIVALCVAAFTQSTLVGNVGALLVGYALVNLWTTISNAVGVMRLERAFNAEVHRLNIASESKHQQHKVSGEADGQTAHT